MTSLKFCLSFGIKVLLSTGVTSLKCCPSLYRATGATSLRFCSGLYGATGATSLKFRSSFFWSNWGDLAQILF